MLGPSVSKTKIPDWLQRVHKPELAHHQQGGPLSPGRKRNTRWHNPEIILIFQ